MLLLNFKKMRFKNFIWFMLLFALPTSILAQEPEYFNDPPVNIVAPPSNYSGYIAERGRFLRPGYLGDGWDVTFDKIQISIIQLDTAFQSVLAASAVAALDSITVLRAAIVANQASIAAILDSLEVHRDELDNHTDSIAYHLGLILAIYDSLIVHNDSLLSYHNRLLALEGASLNTEEVQDIVGAMVSGNTENGITTTYQDGDGTIDFEVEVDSGQIAIQSVSPLHLNSTNGVSDNYIPSYDLATEKFTWVADQTGGSEDSSSITYTFTPTAAASLNEGGIRYDSDDDKWKGNDGTVTEYVFNPDPVDTDSVFHKLADWLTISGALGREIMADTAFMDANSFIWEIPIVQDSIVFDSIFCYTRRASASASFRAYILDDEADASKTYIHTAVTPTTGTGAGTSTFTTAGAIPGNILGVEMTAVGGTKPTRASATIFYHERRIN